MPAQRLYKPLSRAELELDSHFVNALAEGPVDSPEIDDMTNESEEAGNRNSNKPDDPGTSLFFADVAFRGDTHRLARLLVEDLEEPEKWSKAELGAMLTHQLGAPLDPELDSPDRNVADGNAGGDPGSPRPTFRDVLFGDSISVNALRRVKEYAKAHLVHRDPFPAEIARVLYYGSVLAARIRCGEGISSLSDAKCRTGVDWVLRQEWIAPEVLEWFRASREVLSDTD